MFKKENLKYLEENRHLIISYSKKRAKKDEYDKNTAIAKLLKKLEKTDNPKSLISNYGYKNLRMLSQKIGNR